MSVSSVSLNSDANVKYQRLANEYSKLRSQAKVLREGVLTERAKIDRLTEEVKSKETTIRKLETENESLLFRNEQLVRRVESLQSEMDSETTANPKKDKSKKTSPSKDVLNQLHSMTIKVDLLEGELRNKLNLNEELIIQIADNDRIHAEDMAEISNKFAKELRSLESQIEDMQRTASNFKIMSKDNVSDAHRANVERRVEKPVEAVRPLEKEYALHLNGVSEQTENNNTLEIESPTPPHSIDETHQMVAESTKSVLSAFHNLFNLFQQRTEIYPYDITMETLPKQVEKLSSQFAQCAGLFKDSIDVIENCLEKTQFEISEDMPKLQSKVDIIARHCNNLLSSLVQRMMAEENKVTWCTPPLEKLNEEWSQRLVKLFECFSLLSQSLSSQDAQKILEDVSAVASNCSELSTTFERRLMYESRLPTATRRMRCVTSTLASSLVQLANETWKLHARAATVYKIMVESERTEEEGSRIEHLEIKERNNPFDDENDVDEKRPTEMVDHSVICSKCGISAENERTIPSLSERSEKEDQEILIQSKDVQIRRKEHDAKIMTAELEVLRERVSELQGERDKTNIDLSLLKRKLELANGNQQYNMSDIDHLRMIGKQQSNILLARATRAECSVRYYKNECEMIVALYRELEKDGEHLKNEIEDLKRIKIALEDELASVRRGYEAQLGELSDHVASLMNAEKERAEAESTAALRTPKNSRSGLKMFFK